MHYISISFKKRYIFKESRPRKLKIPTLTLYRIVMAKGHKSNRYTGSTSSTNDTNNDNKGILMGGLITGQDLIVAIVIGTLVGSSIVLGFCVGVLSVTELY